MRRRPLAILLLYAVEPTTTLSYQAGWPRHLLHHPDFRCIPINLIHRRRTSQAWALARARLLRYDAVVMLHSVFSNSPYLDGALLDIVARVRAPKVFFIGNEYKLMPEKMRFCRDAGVSLLISQSDSPRVHALYRAHLGCAVTWLPNTGLDSELFAPRRAAADRDIDIGYRTFSSPLYLGHDERREIARHFLDNARRWGLRVDVSLDAADRLTEPEWAAFLNRCVGQVGTEAGGDFFELTDETRTRVNAYVAEHPEAGIDEIRARFFADRADAVPIRLFSGRNVEAAGTRTVQILLEGHYGGLFVPDVHYIPLKKDFSNAEEAVEKFRDVSYRERIVKNAYDLVTTELTYARLIGRLRAALEDLV